MLDSARHLSLFSAIKLRRKTSIGQFDISFYFYAVPHKLAREEIPSNLSTLMACQNCAVRRDQQINKQLSSVIKTLSSDHLTAIIVS